MKIQKYTLRGKCTDYITTTDVRVLELLQIIQKATTSI